MQNYTNYHVVIIDDASTDGSIEIYKKYLQFYRIDKKYYTLLSNQKKVGALANQYFAVKNYCNKDAIALHVDGDDQLLGMNTLKLFNWAYQTKKAGVIYSNFYFFKQKMKNVRGGFTK